MKVYPVWQSGSRWVKLHFTYLLPDRSNDLSDAYKIVCEYSGKSSRFSAETVVVNGTHARHCSIKANIRALKSSMTAQIHTSEIAAKSSISAKNSNYHMFQK